MGSDRYAEPCRGQLMIVFKNLIVGRHESRVLFVWSPQEGVAILGAFRGIKDGIEAILAREGITPALRVTLEDLVSSLSMRSSLSS